MMRTRQIYTTATAIFFLFLICSGAAYAHSSKAWQERLDARKTTLWVEGQDLGGIILNARAELNVTRLEESLKGYLEKDRDVDEWVLLNLNYYSSSRKDTRTKMKGRDVFVVNYRAIKYWDFDPTKLQINGRTITSEDILTRTEYWDSGELAPGTTGTLAVSAPSVKPKTKIEFIYEEARAILEVPGK